jgi:uncharacterized CHY-type Zn-finger protein
MICPECNGEKVIHLIKPDMWDEIYDTFIGEIICPTCEGYGEVIDSAASKHCPACGEPIGVNQDWCEEHKAAAFLDND